MTKDIAGCCSVVRGVVQGVAVCCSICTDYIYRGIWLVLQDIAGCCRVMHGVIEGVAV